MKYSHSIAHWYLYCTLEYCGGSIRKCFWRWMFFFFQRKNIEFVVSKTIFVVVEAFFLIENMFWETTWRVVSKTTFVVFKAVEIFIWKKNMYNLGRSREHECRKSTEKGHMTLLAKLTWPLTQAGIQANRSCTRKVNKITSILVPRIQRLYTVFQLWWRFCPRLVYFFQFECWKYILFIV